MKRLLIDPSNYHIFSRYDRNLHSSYIIMRTISFTTDSLWYLNCQIIKIDPFWQTTIRTASSLKLQIKYLIVFSTSKLTVTKLIKKGYGEPVVAHQRCYHITCLTVLLCSTMLESEMGSTDIILEEDWLSTSFILFKFHFLPSSIWDERCTNQVTIVVL